MIPGPPEWGPINGDRPVGRTGINTAAKRNATGTRPQPYAIQAISRAYRLFHALARSRDPKQLGELSAEVGLHKTTALRLLRTFIAEGLLTQDPATGRYLLNPAFWIRVATLACPAVSLVLAIQDILDQLARETGGTALVVLPDEVGRSGILAMYAFPPVGIYIDPAVHLSTPLHATAAGKCYLAHLDDARLTEYLRGHLLKLTDNTITSPRRLRDELAKVRQQGYATNLEEMERAAFSFSVPLRDSAGAVVGGLSLGFSARRLTERDVNAALPLARRAADGFHEMLGPGWWAAERWRLERDALPPPAQVDTEDPGFGDGALPIVRSLARAVRAIGLLTRLPEGALLSEIARRRGLTRGTAFRVLMTLEAAGMASRDAGEGRYRINPLFWVRIAPVLLSTSSLAKGAGAILEWLADATGATAIFACPDVTERESVAFHYALPQRAVAFHPSRDIPPPLHAVASGKCYMAAQSKRWIIEYVEDGLRAVTEHTIASSDALMEELETVRRQGYAVNREESIMGAGGLAVAVVDAMGRAVGALSLAPLASEVQEPNIRRWLPLLRSGPEALSRLLAVHWREFSVSAAKSEAW